ncbi:suppressor 3 family protein [Schizosaccharomyces japonicus yFS275]|uniref:Suppressor 3 family protein n=1 Tax=Schizosaccharomyces japonicus (strain yFS275 / FY16936) TaxID=402676 RepID=B6K5T0_SCHJY|nr:suppressor 3 family protein [Schizosaccharomyces japonicus yFS275]EEB08884.1 suppressor 3 family protein [Schizosaccharomyces japonicus yFS275]
MVPFDSAGKRVPCKLVVRKLPANLPASVFWDSVKPWHEAIERSRFHPGHLQPEKDLEVHSYAILLFKSPEQVTSFFLHYQNHAFVNKNNVRYHASVAVAPNQKWVAHGRKDSRMGTLEEDEDFIQFKKSLESAEADSSLKPSFPLAPEDSVVTTEPVKTTTPLLEYVKAKQQKAQERAQHRKEKARQKKLSKQQRKQQQQDAAGGEPLAAKSSGTSAQSISIAIPADATSATANIADNASSVSIESPSVGSIPAATPSSKPSAAHKGPRRANKKTKKQSAESNVASQSLNPPKKNAKKKPRPKRVPKSTT